MLTLATLTTLSFLFCFFYLLGLFNAKIANKIELLIFTLTNLRLNKENTRKIDKKVVKLVRILLYRRTLFIKKLATRKFLKEANKKPA
jgi:hypothetical protein